MLLNEFKKQITLLSQVEANRVRDLYIENFIDVTKQGYKNNIVDKLLFTDGYCYTGYLWDYLKKHQRISIQSLINELLNKDTVLVFWDIHTCERIYIKDYWKFGKEAVIEVDVKHLIDGLNYFPEHIYIFDYNLKWTYIITHEDDGKRKICYKVD